MEWYFLRWLAGAIVWALANAVYWDLRRKGIGGFGRFAAFWAGLPGTLISYFISAFLVGERRIEQLDPPPDDEERLLRDIRVDRELRALGGSPLTEEDNKGG